MLNVDAKTTIPRYGIAKDTIVVLWHGAMPILTNDRMIIAVSELAKRNRNVHNVNAAALIQYVPKIQEHNVLTSPSHKIQFTLP